MKYFIIKKPPFLKEFEKDLNFQHYLNYVHVLPTIDLKKLSHYHKVTERLQDKKAARKQLFLKKQFTRKDSILSNESNEIKKNETTSVKKDSFYVERSETLYKKKMNFMKGFFEVAKVRSQSMPKIQTIPTGVEKKSRKFKSKFK